MAGHMGARNRTQQNLEIVRTDVERGLLFVRGSVPGHKGSWLLVKDAVKVPRPRRRPYPAGILEIAARSKHRGAPAGMVEDAAVHEIRAAEPRGSRPSPSRRPALRRPPEQAEAEAPRPRASAPAADEARRAKHEGQGSDPRRQGGRDIELNDAVFGVEPRADILHRVVTWQLEKRRGTARAARERSDVARTGKKFGRQKGGGTARHGDRRAPIFIGGGKAHGPRARDFAVAQQEGSALGLKMALSAKAQDGQLVVVDNLDLTEARPRRSRSSSTSSTSARTALVIDGDALNVGFARASSNLAEINLIPAVGANVYDILNHETLVLTRAAVEKLEARFNG